MSNEANPQARELNNVESFPARGLGGRYLLAKTTATPRGMGHTGQMEVSVAALSPARAFRLEPPLSRTRERGRLREAQAGVRAPPAARLGLCCLERLGLRHLSQEAYCEAVFLAISLAHDRTQHVTEICLEHHVAARSYPCPLSIPKSMPCSSVN
jgi:hypothetical protein